MLEVVAIFIGGGLGSILRYLTSIMYMRWFSFNIPLATLSVNILGAFILGAFMAFLTEHSGVSPAVKYGLTVGFCGGLTTFSTFSFEIFDFFKRGEYLIAFVYMFLSFTLTILVTTAGFYWAKSYV